MFAALNRHRRLVRQREQKQFARKRKHKGRPVHRQPTYEQIKTIVTGSQPGYHTQPALLEVPLTPEVPVTLTSDVTDSQNRQEEIKYLLSFPDSLQRDKPKPGTSKPVPVSPTPGSTPYQIEKLITEKKLERVKQQSHLQQYTQTVEEHRKATERAKEEQTRELNREPYREPYNEYKTHIDDVRLSDVPLSDYSSIKDEPLQPKRFIHLRPKLEGLVSKRTPEYGYFEDLVSQHINNRHEKLEHYVSQLRLEQKNKAAIPDIPRNVVKFNVDITEDGLNTDLDILSYRKFLFR